MFIVKNRALSLDNVYYTPYNVFSRDTQGIQIIKTIRGECTYMEYNYYSIGDRIRNLRVQNNMTQDEFKEELGKHGLRIGRNTISSIENGKESAFTFDFLKTASKIFCCDIGYLLGEYNEKKIETHYICEVTGLSEKSVNKLLDFNNGNDVEWGMDLINYFIESDKFGILIFYLLQYATRPNSNIDYAFYSINTKDMAFTKIQDTMSEISKELFYVFENILNTIGDTRICYSVLEAAYKKGKITKEEYIITHEELDKGNYNCIADEDYPKQLKERLKHKEGNK